MTRNVRYLGEHGVPGYAYALMQTSFNSVKNLLEYGLLVTASDF